MNVKFRYLLISLLIFVLIAAFAIPAFAEDNISYISLDKPISVDPNNPAFDVPKGTIIYHNADGTTKIKRPNNRQTIAIKDSDSALINTQNGLKKSTDIYNVPSNSHIDSVENATKVYYEDELILTVINQSNSSNIAIPTYTGWLECSYDWSVSDLDLFYADWDVPSDPPSPGANVIDFLFNAIEPDTGTSIIQPVLEWNNGGSGRWTGAAWVAYNGGSYRATPINANEDDTINGNMWYNGSYTGWSVVFYNESTSQISSLTTTVIDTDDLAVFCALEGYYITDDDDVPGDTPFHNMEFEYNNSDVDITWMDDDDIPSGSGLSFLGVLIFGDNYVQLLTAN